MAAVYTLYSSRTKRSPAHPKDVICFPVTSPMKLKDAIGLLAQRGGSKGKGSTTGLELSLSRVVAFQLLL